MFLQPDHWLQKVIEIASFKIAPPDHNDPGGANWAGDFKEWLTHEPERRIFVYAKIPVSSVEIVKQLEEVGFHLIDTTVRFEKTIDPCQGKPVKTGLTIRFARPEDEKQVTGLAGRSFCYSRFHLDRNLPLDLANAVKIEWTRSFFLGLRGQHMVVAELSGKICGFLQILEVENNLIIDLIATDGKHRGAGIGGAMIRFAETTILPPTSILVGTQLANGPSLSFYQGIGFKLLDANYILHFHRIPKEAAGGASA